MKHGRVTGFLAERNFQRLTLKDVFIFPSGRRASGNVAQEAFASAVPAIVTDQGGPKILVKPGETGFVAKGLDDFVRYTIELMDDPAKLLKMKEAARASAMSRSWDAVFESVYDGYRQAFELRERNLKV